MIDAWVYVKPDDWNELRMDLVQDSETLSKSATSAFTGAIAGFWDPFTGGYEVYNVLASRADIEEIVSNLTDVHAVYTWTQGPGTDEFNEDGSFNTLPPDILAVMKDHVTYDQNGNPTGSTPATYENPHWGHVFFGQGTRIFAGSFTDDFDESFK